MPREYYSDKIMKQLEELTREKGHEITFKEAQKETIPYPNIYASYFGSFQKAAAMAWSKVRRENEGVTGAVLTPMAKAMIKATR